MSKFFKLVNQAQFLVVISTFTMGIQSSQAGFFGDIIDRHKERREKIKDFRQQRREEHKENRETLKGKLQDKEAPKPLENKNPRAKILEMREKRLADDKKPSPRSNMPARKPASKK